MKRVKNGSTYETRQLICLLDVADVLAEVVAEQDGAAPPQDVAVQADGLAARTRRLSTIKYIHAFISELFSVKQVKKKMALLT
jgi:hypothetical protein